MAKLTDDPRVAEAIAKAETRGANAERKRINGILKDLGDGYKNLTDKAEKKTATGTLKAIKDEIRAGA